ncbi:MAG: nucleoside phosphorylase [Paracoccaceae bacterium]
MNGARTTPPILANKHHDAASVFTPESLLREAKRQKGGADINIPEICILDPDGDIVRYLKASGRARSHPGWVCYHTELQLFDEQGVTFGIVGCAVGASFAVLVAEEMFVSGCKLLISITSAGQIFPLGRPPYFILIEKALRDEGTSYHYMPPTEWSAISPALLDRLAGDWEPDDVPILRGSTWTTDAPFRETAAAITAMRDMGVHAVEMEAAALYALSAARKRPIICFAHVTNQMGIIEDDFEKGEANGAFDALSVVHRIAVRLNGDVGQIAASTEATKGPGSETYVITI